MKKLLLFFAIVTLFNLKSSFAQSGSILPDFMIVPKATSAPTCAVAEKGKLYFNTTDNKMYFCNGLAWVDFSGGAFTLPFTGSGDISSSLVSLTNSGSGNVLKTSGKLQFTNINEAEGKTLVSDATGNANWTGAVAFMAYKNTNTTIVNNIGSVLSGVAEVFDEGDNLSDGLFTAPIDGIYHFSAGVKWGTNTSASNISIATFQKCANNGSNCSIMASSKIYNNVASQNNLSVDIKLFAGQKVGIFVTQSNSDNTPRVFEGEDVNGNRSSYFSGHLVR